MLALPLLAGQGLALKLTGTFSAEACAVALSFAVCCQIFILYLNDYADEAVDRLGSGSWLSGGSGVLTGGQLAPRDLCYGAAVALAGMGLCTAWGASLVRPGMWMFAVLAALAAWSYSLGPIRASYRGFGEGHQAISCGLLLPLLGFYLQTGAQDSFPWGFLFPLLLLFFAANIVTALPDVDADRAGGKRSFAVRHGDRSAVLVAAALSSVAALCFGLSLNLWYPMGASLVWVSAPAILLSGFACRAGMVECSGASTASARARFATLATLGQGWALLSWTLALLWPAGLNAHSLL